MRDGAALLAKRYYPAGGGSQPTVLVRSCYGIGGPFGLIERPRACETAGPAVFNGGKRVA